MGLNQELMTGSMYSGKELHGLFGGQRGTRISTPKALPLILLFARREYCSKRENHCSDVDCLRFGPEEGWHDDGFYHFRGERQMQFVRGNRAVRDHARDGKLLFLFEGAGSAGSSVNERTWRFVGPMECAGHYFTRVSTGKVTIMFRLVPISSWSPWQTTFLGASCRSNQPHDSALPPNVGRYPLAFLKSRPDAIAARAERTRPGYPSSARDWLANCLRVQGYAHDRAFGFCELCGKPAPFADSRGEPCLEVHYMLRPYDSGVDPVHCLAACCLECHRKIHCEPDGGKLDATLTRKIASIERSIDRGKLLTVAAGIIRDADGKVLLTQRGHGALAGKWEFPGGKVEAGETLEDCLTREIREELDLGITDVQPLAASVHHYEDFAVRLFGLLACATGSDVKLWEHSERVWVWPNQLASYDLSPADIPVAVAAARLLG